MLDDDVNSLRRTKAELQQRLDEAFAREAATAEVLGVINSSPGELAPVFDAILEKTLRLCDAPCAILWIFDGERFQATATRGLAPKFAEYLRTQNSSRSLRGIQSGEPFRYILDAAAEDAYRDGEPMRRAFVDLGGGRSALIVPLEKDKMLVGAIRIFRQEVRPFTEKQIALLQNFAAQAVIAMENARLLTETREALEQQTATAEVLQVINSSPGHITPVFDAVLEKALRLCDGAHGNLTIYDGEYFRRAASLGAPPAFTEFIDSLGPIRPAAGTTMGRFVEGENIANILDVTAEDAYRQGAPVRKAIVELSGCRTLVAVALRKDGRLLGQITVYRREVRPFTDKQIALLQNFASQAVIAMENARLMSETREALEQQTATAEVLQVINASPGDLAPVFDAILEKAHTLCGAARGTLFLFDGEMFRAAAAHGYPEELAERLRRGVSTPEASVFAPLLAGARLVHNPDLTTIDDPMAQLVAEHGGVRTNLLVPLRNDTTLLGVISCNRLEVRPFTDQQIALLQNFASQAVIAMENARLLGELRQRTEEVAELNRGLEARVAEQVEELGRVGRLKRFLAPQLAELIVSQGDEKILESHRREIVVVFCDLRGYTAFTETAEPEEVLDFLREYHGALGPLVSQFEGTLDQFSGDGIMVFFNDPVPIPDPAERAVKMAVAMRETAGALIANWRERGRDLGFGAGIAQGYATLGQIGFSERSGYTAIGTVCNVAARLCAEAKDGQILLSQRVNAALTGSISTEQVGALALKGLTQPVMAYNVPLAGTRPALHVIEGSGPQSA